MSKVTEVFSNEFIRQGILSCCKDIENNIDKIMNNFTTEGNKCSGCDITIEIKPDCIPAYTETYYYISEDFCKIARNEIKNN